jgi:hypothetical protein
MAGLDPAMVNSVLAGTDPAMVNSVLAGLDPAIHVFHPLPSKTRVTVSGKGMTEGV